MDLDWNAPTRQLPVARLLLAAVANLQLGARFSKTLYECRYSYIQASIDPSGLERPSTSKYLVSGRYLVLRPSDHYGHTML